MPTLGLSFLMPNICVRDAKTEVLKQIEKANRKKLQEKGLELVLRLDKTCTSWLEFRKLRDADTPKDAKDALLLNNTKTVEP